MTYTKQKNQYTEPAIKVVAFQIERGFSASGEDSFSAPESDPNEQLSDYTPNNSFGGTFADEQ